MNICSFCGTRERNMIIKVVKKKDGIAKYKVCSNCYRYIKTAEEVKSLLKTGRENW